jgi:hypothetical protein
MGQLQASAALGTLGLAGDPDGAISATPAEKDLLVPCPNSDADPHAVSRGRAMEP